MKKRKLSFYIYLIFVYFLIMTGGTYAYMYVTASNNSIAGNGGCFGVNYSGEEINASNLLSTTNYEEGAATTVTLSKASGCEIYTYANIYIHTNDSTTAPIEEFSALRYKIVTSGTLGVVNSTKEYNGIVSKKGDFLLATVPLTTTETAYTIYIWIDPTLSNGQYNDTTYSGYIYATSTQTSTVGGNDTQVPTLFLSKETYVEGFDGWTLTNATVDSDGVLVLAETGTSGSALSDYYNVDGQNWTYIFDAYTTSVSTKCTSGGCASLNTYYFDDNFQSLTSVTGYSANGSAPKLTLNTWKNSLSWKNLGWSASTTDKDVKNIKVAFYTGNDWSQPVTKIRNFKVYGQLPSSFYNIYIESMDNIGVTQTKYAYGEQDKSYFNNNGTTVTGNYIRVTQNGYYTIYVKDNAGNETISTIEITKIK